LFTKLSINKKKQKQTMEFQRGLENLNMIKDKVIITKRNYNFKNLMKMFNKHHADTTLYRPIDDKKVITRTPVVDKECKQQIMNNEIIMNAIDIHDMEKEDEPIQKTFEQKNEILEPDVYLKSMYNRLSKEIKRLKTGTNNHIPVLKTLSSKLKPEKSTRLYNYSDLIKFWENV
jgi:hypothetical protein